MKHSAGMQEIERGRAGSILYGIAVSLFELTLVGDNTPHESATGVSSAIVVVQLGGGPMADVDTRVESLEDEVKVLKGEVRRTLVDLRALLMREDSPLNEGNLGAGPVC